MNNKIMSEKKAKILVVMSAVFLLIVGVCLYKLFDYQGFNNGNDNNKLINYAVKDYVETIPVIFDGYDGVYSKINVSKVDLKNLNTSSTSKFLKEEEELISYITSYKEEISLSDDYTNNNTVNSAIKMQVNNAILSIFYELDFILDENIFNSNIKKYIVTTNIDLATEKALSNDDLLKKYNYTKEYIAEKIFTEDVQITKNQIVIDKNTNISLTNEDIERNRDDYINRIISDFDNIINMYIDNKSLVLIYNKKELKNLFFDGDFDVEIITRYLK